MYNTFQHNRWLHIPAYLAKYQAYFWVEYHITNKQTNKSEIYKHGGENYGSQENRVCRAIKHEHKLQKFFLPTISSISKHSFAHCIFMMLILPRWVENKPLWITQLNFKLATNSNPQVSSTWEWNTKLGNVVVMSLIDKTQR